MVDNYNKNLLLGITILPHFFHLPLIINLYIIIFAIYLYFQDRFNQRFSLLFFGSIGLFFGLFEYIQYLSATNLIKFYIYIEIVTSVLIYAITLQMISDINHRLVKLSPIFLIIMALFYYNNIYFLFYTIFILYIFVLSVINTNARLDLRNSAKYTTSLFITALPFVIILFIVFPRIAYKKGDFGFKQKAIITTGFGEGFNLNDSGEEVLESNQIAMEVGFKTKMPLEDKLYFRGVVFYTYDGIRKWKKSKINLKLPDIPDSKFSKKENLTSYDVIIYPHLQKIMFSLDIPTTLPKDGRISEDFIIRHKNIIKELTRYSLTSTLDYQITSLEPRLHKLALEIPKNLNPKTKELGQKIMANSKSDKEKLENIKDFMRGQNFEYTLVPSPLDSDNKIDQLLFETKNGYCMHFSAGFAILAREAGLPTRIVTGYRGNLKESIQNYLIVREKDAHAWCEVWIKDEGWVRVDPTIYSFLADGSSPAAGGQNEVQAEQKSLFWQKVSLYSMFVKYRIENWVLYYSHLKQLKLLKQIQKDKKVLFYYFAVFVGLIALIYLISKLLFRGRKEDEVVVFYQKFLKKMAKKGFVKKSYEPALSFANRVKIEEVDKITNLYLKLKYQNNSSVKILKEFKEKIKNLNNFTFKENIDSFSSCIETL